MFEEALDIRSSDRMESFADNLHECLLGTSTRFSQIALELAERLLYGVEVRRIGRQVDESSHPLPSINSLILSPLWELKLSITTTWPLLSVGHRTSSRS